MKYILGGFYKYMVELEMNYMDSWKNLTEVTKNDSNRRN